MTPTTHPEDRSAWPAPAGPFEITVATLPGLCDPGLAIAASRAGSLGLLDLTHLRDVATATTAVERLMRLARGRYGVVMHGRLGEVERTVLDALSRADASGRAEMILLLMDVGDVTGEAIDASRAVARRVGMIAIDEDMALLAERLGLDFVVAKGNEAGGPVGDETTFVLLQRLISRVGLPIHAWGGIGPATAAACRAAGAAGVVLDWQLALMRESSLPASFRVQVARMDGSETTVVAGPGGWSLRLYARPGATAKDQLQNLADHIREEGGDDTESWQRTIGALLAEPAVDDRLWAVGQDGAFASHWADKAPTVARALAWLNARIEDSLRSSFDEDLLGAGSPLARSHGTEFAIVQGPMTRVSDVPEFCEAVAVGGALPFLALAVMREAEARTLLEGTRARMQGRPWGVGLLGFVDRELRTQQLAAVEEVRPPYVVIAGGRPDQASSLEAKGIKTYLHVPSPGMLETFLAEGARRFVFEGRECGGHVGPRSSFVLWELMIQILLEAPLADADFRAIHVVFAGGVHDGLGGAMVSVLAQPLVRRGIKVGVWMGTAYLFTEEIVRTGAIVPGFQDVAIAARGTVLVESGPGHAVRCVENDFARAFDQEKVRLKRESRPAEEIRQELDQMNLGRLRVASKGLARVADPASGRSSLKGLDRDEQRRDGLYMIGQVSALRQEACTIRNLHEEVCRGARARIEALRESRATSIEVLDEGETAPPPLDVAIVGMGCLLPGSSEIGTFWENILARRDLVGEVPPHRFDSTAWYDADRRARDKVYSRWGGFLDEIPFDPLKYGIPPAAMRSIEPGQLLALELVGQALRDAGYESENPHKERTSVIFGVSGGIADLGAKYIVRALLPQFVTNPDDSLWDQLPEWTEDSFAGILPNVVSGRISNRFGFGGMNFTVDAACASSLAALTLACRTLADGTSDMAIAGGCDTVQNAFAYLCFAKSGALSPRGRSRPFDAGADGIAISEGLAAVVLKRRADAERDGDRIYAVIKGVAGGSDGRCKGLTSPRVEGQDLTLRRAYAQAGFSPATVRLFEAHGTGTAVGDATECQALAAFLRRHGAPAKSAALGSVKSMIGHTKSAAGITGVIKAALALHHRILPPTLHVETPNAKAGLLDGPMYVNSETRPWLGEQHPRRVGVSSFGFGGTNFHAVLEEYADHARSGRAEAPYRRWPVELFVLAGKTPADLLTRARDLATKVRQVVSRGEEPDLTALASAQHRSTRAADCARLAIVSAGATQLLEQLDAAAAAIKAGSSPSPAAGIYYQAEPLGSGTPLAFVFPGQGAQFPDMIRDLAVAFPEVATSLERADAAFRGRHDRPLSQFLFPPPPFSGAEREGAADALKATEVAQPALGACGLALCHLLRSFGVRPGMTAGHSYGELVALYAAGSLDEDSLHRLSWARGDAIVAGIRDAEVADPGTMLAVQADRDAVIAALNGCDDAWVANHNSPSQVAISGTTPGIERASRALAAASMDVVRIPVACAFHSPLMTPARDRFGRTLEETTFRPPVIPVYSNVTASAYPADPAPMRDLLKDQLVHGVRFVEQVEAMYSAGARVFVEVGPGRVVSKFVGQILGDRPHAAIALQARDACGLTQILHALAALIAQGVAVDLGRLFEGRLDPSGLPGGAIASPRRNPGAHLWMVDGGDARPMSEPKRMPVPLATLVGPRAEGPSPSATPSISHQTTAHAASHAMHFDVTNPIADDARAGQRNGRAPSVPESGRRPAVAGTMAGAALAADAYAEYQKTMRRFLKSQDTVFEAYLGGMNAAAEPSWEAPWPSRQPGPEDASACPPPEPPTATSEGEATSAARLVVADVDPAPMTIPTPPVPAAPKHAAEDLERLLVAVTSERTGYPAEMLDLDAGLEADLGIDSIKRVELIGAFRRVALPSSIEPPATFMEEMTAARTLRAILAGVERLGEATTDSVPPDRDPEPDSDPDGGEPPLGRSDRAPRCVGVAVEVPLEPLVESACLTRVVVLTDEGRGIAQALAAEIDAKGGRARLLGPEALADRDAAARAVDQIRREFGPIGGVVHLLPLQVAPSFPGINEVEWAGRVEAEVKGLLYLVQAVVPELEGRVAGDSPIVVAVSIGGGDFDAAGRSEAEHPWRGGLAGFLKVAAAEWPTARFRAIDVDEIPDVTLLHAELMAAGPVEIGYRRGRRLTIRPQREELPEAAPAGPAVELNADSVILITGGALGITGEIAREVATRTGATLILVGRSAAPSLTERALTAGCPDAPALRRVVHREMSGSGQAAGAREIEAEVQALLKARQIRQTLDDLRDAGARAEYLACDLRDARALEAVIEDVTRRHGGVDALIHGAGVIEDCHIPAKTSASFDRVFGTKLQPLVTLSRLLDLDRLKLVMLFSSVSGFFGNAGQGDYAAANEALNRVGRRLKGSLPGEVVALNWGPWEGSGMVTAEVARRFAERGVGLVSVAAGRRAAWQETLHRRDDVRAIIGQGPWIDAADELAGTLATPPLLPLLAGQSVRHQPGDLVQCRVVLDTRQHSFLDDHRIDGQAVLPMAVALELMAEAALAGQPGWHVAEVNNLRLFSGIVVEGQTREVSIAAEPIERTEAKAEWRVRIGDPRRPTRPCYESTVRLVPQLPQRPTLPRIEPLREDFPLDAAGAYERWLFHGPTFQVIKQFRGLDDRGLDATLEPRPEADAGWIVDPTLLDAAPQLALLWARAQHESSVLPSRVASFRRFGPVGSGPIELTYRVDPGADGQAVRATAWFHRDGQVLWCVEGLEGVGSVGLNRIGGGAAR